jgi:hypothetical protein
MLHGQRHFVCGLGRTLLSQLAVRDVPALEQLAAQSGPCPGACAVPKRQVMTAVTVSVQVSNYLDKSKAEGGAGPSTDLLQSAVQQAQRLLTRVWEWLSRVLGQCPSASPQVCAEVSVSDHAHTFWHDHTYKPTVLAQTMLCWLLCFPLSVQMVQMACIFLA